MIKTELFESPQVSKSWPPISGRPNPLIELKELVLIGSYAPPNSTELRRIKFHRGLNIVWADPHASDGTRRDRTSGHSAGKTTLCRILRWLLGEVHFGNEDLESRITSEFERGCAILSLHLDGKPWVVGRSFFSRQDHQAVEGDRLQEILTEGWPESADAAQFLSELENLAFQSFPRRKFPGRLDEISWTHLLAWLARDQEAALQTVDTWRSTTSGPQERAPTKFERHILIRMVANLLTSEEWDQIDAELQFQAERKSIAEQIPGIKAVADEACVPLWYLLGNTGDPLAGELVVSSAESALAEEQSRLKTLEQEIAANLSSLARQNHDQAVRELAHANGEVTRRSKHMKRLEKRLGELKATFLKAKANLEMMSIPPEFCGRRKSEVAGKCEFFQDGAENIGAIAMWADLERQQQEIRSEFDAELEEIEEIRKRLPLLTVNEEQARAAVEEGDAARDQLIEKAEGLRFSIASFKAMLLPAQDRWEILNRKTAKADDLTGDIKEARRLQVQIRGGRFSDRLDLADHYRAVLAELLGPDIGGNVLFDKDGQLTLEAENRGTISSAAIEALKTIAFDLASVFRSVVGAGSHPRFLIHDSPKVADMSPALYAALFNLVEQVESHADGQLSFQYLLTTTEPPPSKFMESGHIILRLDSSTAGGRLFGVDL